MNAIAAVHPQPQHPGRSAVVLLLSGAVHGLLLWGLVEYSFQPLSDLTFNPEPRAIQVMVIHATQPVPVPAHAAVQASVSPVSPVAPKRTTAVTPAARVPAVQAAPASTAEAPAQTAPASPVLTAGSTSAPTVAASVGTEKPADAPLVQGHPDYAYNPPPDYPMALRDQGLGGVVWLRVWVDSEGHPGEIRLARGSGYRLLDESAQRAVRTWRFVPARMGEQRQPSWVEFPIRFTSTS